MILNNVKIALAGSLVNIRINDGKIAQLLPEPFLDAPAGFNLTFDNAVIFPGLINSHDHLDFNLFPALGDRIYNNYTEWGRHLHKDHVAAINEVLKIPIALREQWGIYKNLLCGVTTVVNHGKRLKVKTDLITVYEDCQSIHSVQFEKKWKLALNNPFKKKLQAVIHTGEGTDRSSHTEINKLIRWNLLKRELIGVHGVAMNEAQSKAFKALVWCPGSNYFLLGDTAPVNLLKKHTTLLFGTDSTLTGSWNMWEHIYLAHKTSFLTDRELYDTLTVNAAETWNLDSGEIAEGKTADLVIAKMKPGMAGADTFFAVDPEDILLVLHKGKISLFDEELYPQLKGIIMEDYSRVYLNGTCKCVYGNLATLMKEIREYHPKVVFPVV